MTNTLTHLGNKSPIETDPAKVVLDRINNPHPDLFYCARFTAPEFVSQCPITGQPDFATLIIDYFPRKYLVESKSLKLFIFAFKNHGSFHEDCTLTVGRRLFELLHPYWFRITGLWNARGGISIDVVWEAGQLPDNCEKPYLDMRSFRASR